MSPLVMYAADAAAIVTLIALFLRRHGRRDLIAAYLGVNAVLSIIPAAPSSEVPMRIGFPALG